MQHMLLLFLSRAVL